MLNRQKNNQWKIILASAGLLAFSTVLIVSYQNFSATNTELNSEELAHKLHRRLTGVALPMDHETIQQMSTLLQEGKRREAASLATEHPGFLNITVREMASKMSTRDENVSIPLNDFIASFVGTVRDEKDARELLYGDFWYRGDPARVNFDLDNNLVDDILTSNEHYEDLDDNDANLKEALVREEGQFIVNENGNAVRFSDSQSGGFVGDPAGLLTTRAWQLDHTTDGTNRAPIEALLVGFGCMQIAEAHDTSLPDIMVGRDVTRRPDGSYKNYENNCKGCHSFMDGMRPAFAYFDFDDNRIKHSSAYSQRGGDNDEMEFYRPLFEDGIRIAAKYYRAQEEALEGFGVTNNSWKNFTVLSTKGQYQFGWRGQTEGQGVSQLGQMFADSQVFSTCLAKRAFRAACRRDLSSGEERLARAIASDFEARRQYNIRELFHTVATRPECLGQ